MGAPVFGRTGRTGPSLGVRLDGSAARGRGAGDDQCGGLFRVALGVVGRFGATAGVDAGAELSQSVQSIDDHSLSDAHGGLGALGGVQCAGTAGCYVSGWRAVGRRSHSGVGCYGCGGSGRGRGRVFLSAPQRGTADVDAADGAG